MANKTIFTLVGQVLSDSLFQVKKNKDEISVARNYSALKDSSGAKRFVFSAFEKRAAKLCFIE